MANKIFRVDVEFKGVIEVLASDEREAAWEANQVATQVLDQAAWRGLYFHVPDLKPRRVLEKGEGS